MLAVDLRCEYLIEPLGLDERSPRLNWRIESTGRNRAQSAYQIRVASRPDRLETPDLWDSGRVAGDRTSAVPYAGRILEPRQQCWWQVRVWDESGKPSEWSRAAKWGMGLLSESDWKAQWISHRDPEPPNTSRAALHLPPPRAYRREFHCCDRPVKRAVVYGAALGIYQLSINGKAPDDARFAPGWSDYHVRGYYRTHDITALLKKGMNAVGVVLAEGWYSGYVGYGLLVGYGPDRCGRYFYGKTPALRFQIEVEYEDGSWEVVGTDPTWRVTSRQPIREADLLMGESYDARMELPGWDSPAFNDGDWERAIPASENGPARVRYSDAAGQRDVDLGFRAPAHLQAYSGPPVRVTEIVRPIALTEPKPGTWIFDLGQNIAGVARLKVEGPAGAQVKLRFGEMLHKDGRLMTENLRRARAVDTYTLRGGGVERWSPSFTYHGFRYVEVTGYPGKPELSAIEGLAIHSDTPLTSEFECSDPVVNRLFRNIVWTQRANFVELPTDCPQRDERLGWTGDAQTYVRAATWNADVAAFFTKWLTDLEEAQLPNGAYPDYAPLPMIHGGPTGYATAWMDAGIICPITLYEVYGDTRFIERHYRSMSRFMEFRKARSNGFRGARDGNQWGDWLSLGEQTPIELVDAAYFALTSRLMAKAARALGREADGRKYDDWYARIRAQFTQDYVRPDGTLTVDSQTAYVLTLANGLAPEELRAAIAQRLVKKIRDAGVRMTTGFLGTRPLLPVLSANGAHDLAMELFQSRRFPSWGYEVVNGATTIWERWNSYTLEGGIHEPGMNSFSHYAFGAVCEWMFSELAGLDTDGPGFRKVTIRPGLSDVQTADAPRMDRVRALYRSPHGPISVSWKRAEGRFHLDVTLPPNVSGQVHIPATSLEQVKEDGKPVGRAAGVRSVRFAEGHAVVEVGSGTYRFIAG